MRLAQLIRRHQDNFERQYGAQLLPGQRHALEAMVNCRTPACGSSLALCPNCGHSHPHHHSCSHRSCPQCQNHTATEWLQRQRRKLLPVRYYLLTFTLPEHLRATTYAHQRTVYEAMFEATAETVREIALNPRHLGAEPGMTAVLHPHSRRLDYRPHLHIVMPAGGFERKNRLWRQGRRKFLFPVPVLRILFREKFLARLRQAALPYPPALHHRHWVVHVRAAGRGEPALEYLARYLYRGVISENAILSDRRGQVTFQYIDANTGGSSTRTVLAADFLRLVLQHVLPKRFRRVRDYGFLHGNAKAILSRIQILLRQPVPEVPAKSHPPLCCRICGGTMLILTPNRRLSSRTRSRNRAPPLPQAS